MLKLAARVPAEEKVREHLGAEKPDWKSFDKNLRSSSFRSAILQAAKDDPTLKKYVKNFGGYQASKDVVARIKSASSGKTYVVKDLHNGRWGCNCGDWQYAHSVKGGDCKHIKSVKKSKLVKRASAVAKLGLGAVLSTRMDANARKGRQVKQLRPVLRQAYGMPA
jgi:SWIM zinc finger